MGEENEKVSDCFSDDYKNLPLKARVKVNLTARELLEIQEKNKALLGGWEKPALEDDSGGKANYGN